MRLTSDILTCNGFNALQPSYTKQGLINDIEARHSIFPFIRIRSQFSVVQIQQCPRCGRCDRFNKAKPPDYRINGRMLVV